MTITSLWLWLVVGISSNLVCMAVKHTGCWCVQKHIFFTQRPVAWIAPVHTYGCLTAPREENTHLMWPEAHTPDISFLTGSRTWTKKKNKYVGLTQQLPRWLKCVHTCSRCTFNKARNNKENAFKWARLSQSRTVEGEQLHLSLHSWHKRLHVSAAGRLGSYNSAFCFILVKVGRKTSGECIKKNRQIKNADQKDGSNPPPPGIKFDSLLQTLNTLCRCNVVRCDME